MPTTNSLERIYVQTSVPFTIWDVLCRMGSPGFLGKDEGTHISSPFASGTSVLEKGGLCVWRSRNLQTSLQGSAHARHLSQDHFPSRPCILQLLDLSTKSRCIFYASHHRDKDADFHSYRRGGRNGKDKLGHLIVCSCEIHFQIAALQA